MKTQITKQLEQAVVNDAFRKNKHPALEVPFWHTKSIGENIWGRIGQGEFIDAVIEKDGMFTCLELKISMSDLHSNAAQTYVGNRNFLVCPIKMAEKIKVTNDSWLKDNPDIGIIGWDGKDSFKIIKRCKINYSLPANDQTTLAKGMIESMSKELRKEKCQRTYY